jgi:hypothetical protein
MKAQGKNVREKMGAIEKQAKLEDYESPLDDYMEMAIQYGYVVLFSAALPIIPLLALIEIIFEIRVDAWKLCSLTKRPFPQAAEDIGVWRDILSTISYFGAISNAAIIIFTSGSFDKIPSIIEVKNAQTGLVEQDQLFTLLVIFMALEHTFFFIKFVIGVAVPDVPENVKDGLAWSSRVAKEKLIKKIDESSAYKSSETVDGVSSHKHFKLEPHHVAEME